MRALIQEFITVEQLLDLTIDMSISATLAFLQDGEALAAMGISDRDTQIVEEVHATMIMLNEVENSEEYKRWIKA